MDHAIYTAMGAASQTLNQQAVTASNWRTPPRRGFRAQLNALRAVPVEGLSLPTRTLVTASTPGADMTPRPDGLHRASAGRCPSAGRLAGGANG